MDETQRHPLSGEQLAELQRLKSYFPFRIVFGVLKADGTFEAHARATRHTANKLARDGHQVFILK